MRKRDTTAEAEQGPPRHAAGRTLTLRTPCRLHFGLLAYNDPAGRQFGGVGLMVQRPRIALEAALAEPGGARAVGPMSARVARFADRFNERGIAQGLIDQPAHVAWRITEAPRAHTGLGTGTQLGMAVGQAMAQLAGLGELAPAEIAQLVGRGERSAIGAHGFGVGGLIVEGGKQTARQLSPMLARLEFPQDWHAVLVCPERLQGLHGRRERAAFDAMPAFPREVTAEMCRLVLMGLCPAVAEADLPSFGAALHELQQIVGRCFAQAQGGVFADPQLEAMAKQMHAHGAVGAGQSSWGPTIYSFVSDRDRAEHLARQLAEAFNLGDGEVIVTAADNTGARWRWAD